MKTSQEEGKGDEQRGRAGGERGRNAGGTREEGK